MRKRYKKIICILLICTFVMTFFGCGNSDSDVKSVDSMNEAEITYLDAEEDETVTVNQNETAEETVVTDSESFTERINDIVTTTAAAIKSTTENIKKIL